jgi:type II secretory pathway pseudopilin PulG
MNVASELNAESVPAPKKRRASRGILISGGVVIFLIASGLYFGPPILMEARAQAKHGAATAVANQIGQAATSYYYDNNKLPVPPGTTLSPGGRVFSTDTPEGLEVVNLLAGNNPGKIRYLVMREAKNNKDGVVWDPSGTRITGFYDPWGNPYMIALDTNYDEKITVPFKIPVFINGKRCSVYSAVRMGSSKRRTT